MPEGPELAHSRDRLKMLLSGKRIADMSIGTSGRYLKKPPEGLEQILLGLRPKGAGPEIAEIGTRGKFMWWKLIVDDDPLPWYMHCTYGMSGGWFKTSTKHTAFVVTYSDSGSPLLRDTHSVFFNDPRHFGTVKFVRGEDAHAAKLATLGPCILGQELTPEIFTNNVLRKHTRTIAEALMDQRVVAGIGNYIKAECLHRVGISPWRPVTDIPALDYVSLYNAVVNVADESYRSQGATISTYRTIDGSRGNTQFSFRVYSRKTCPSGHPVKREETPDGRTSHWCPVCQK